MKKIWIIAGILVVGLFLAKQFFSISSSEITAYADGFTPQTVTIKKGDTVTFKNESGTDIWPASNAHPTHELYSAFDPKRPILSGDSWDFIFDTPGTWGFHDHLYPIHTGTIIVTE